MFTTGNMACGFSAILLAFADQFTWAAAMLAGSIVLDIADGAVARLVGATSPFGVQLDSLADLVSFGLAPAVLVHTWALPENPVLAWLSAFFWLACAAFRPRPVQRHGRPARRQEVLRRAAQPRRHPGRDRDDPGAAHPASTGRGCSCRSASASYPALLMVTTVRFRSFRGLLSPQDQPGARHDRRARRVALRRRAWCWTPAATGLVVACAYLLTAPLGVLTAPVRAKVFGPQAVAPPRHRMQSVFLPIIEDCPDD